MNNLLFVLIVLAIAAALFSPVILGVGGFGPRQEITTQVISKHVDVGHHHSHYMVTTNAGTFEVDNGLMLGMWNSDEVYGRLQEGKTYELTVAGREYVNFFMQHYRFITAGKQVTK